VDRVVPAREHEQVERTIRLWEGTPPPGTQLRFRLQGLRARFITYNHYWNRILHQIETGTYTRDLQRLARKQEAMQRREAAAPAAAEEAQPTEAEAAVEEPAAEEAPVPAGEEAVAEAPAAEASAAEATKERPRAKKTGEARRPRKREQAAPQLPPGMTAREARALFKELVEKKRAAGEKTDGLTYGALLSKLSKQVPKLKERHGDAAFRFEVATDGGRVRLKAKRT
jgi:hypothetical protein